jgi:hypothetical protein
MSTNSTIGLTLLAIFYVLGIISLYLAQHLRFV